MTLHCEIDFLIQCVKRMFILNVKPLPLKLNCVKFVYKFLPPANEVCEGYVFTGVCLSTGGACMVAHRGGCAVALGGMVAPGGHTWLLLGGCVWLLGGMRGCSGGACVVAPGGACMVAPRGACVVALGGHAWLLWRGGMRSFFDEIRSMSGRYASYWNAFLLIIFQ